MSSWVPIWVLYYCDGPRLVLARHDGRVYLLDSFDEEFDDFVEEYTVYELPPGTRDEDLSVHPGEGLRTAWDRWLGMATARLGTIPLDRDRFDPGLQRADRGFLDEIARLNAP